MSRRHADRLEVSRRAVVTSGLTLVAVAAGVGAITTRRSFDPPETSTALESSTSSATSPTRRTPTSATPPTTSPSPRRTTASPAPRAARPVAGFSEDVEEYLEHRPGSAGVAAVNLTTGAWTEHRPTGEFLAASIVKLEILIALLLQLEADGREPSVAQTRRARQMITASDNDAADELWGDIGGRSGLGQACRKLGMTHTVPAGGGYWGATRTTPRDQLRVVQALVDPGALQHAHCGYVRGLMHDVAPEQRWGISAAGDKETCELKNGWLPSKTDGGLWVINSIGRVVLPRGDLALISVLSRRSPSMGAGIATVERLAKMAGEALV